MSAGTTPGNRVRLRPSLRAPTSSAATTSAATDVFISTFPICTHLVRARTQTLKVAARRPALPHLPRLVPPATEGRGPSQSLLQTVQASGSGGGVATADGQEGSVPNRDGCLGGFGPQAAERGQEASSPGGVGPVGRSVCGQHVGLL